MQRLKDKLRRGGARVKGRLRPELSEGVFPSLNEVRGTGLVRQ